MTKPASIEQGRPLAPLTTLNVGGEARYLASVTSAAALREALGWAAAQSVPVAVMGGGSNVVVSDAGYHGLVVRPALTTVQWGPERDGHVEVHVGAGVDWVGLVDAAVARGLGGIECLAGIPGWAGAAPVQNVGAYGQQVSDCLVGVEVMARHSGMCATLPATSLGLGYRDSLFKRAWRDRYVIVDIVMRLALADRGMVAYAELEQALGPDAATASVGQVRDAVLMLRRRKSMVLDAADPNTRSAGSFFVNPTVASDEAARLLAAHPALPTFPAKNGRSKLSAAWLIERAGFGRGYVDGPVGLSSRHALAIINRGGATAADIARFAHHLMSTVEACFGVRLTMEPQWLGDGAPVAPHAV